MGRSDLSRSSRERSSRRYHHTHRYRSRSRSRDRRRRRRSDSREYKRRRRRSRSRSSSSARERTLKAARDKVNNQQSIHDLLNKVRQITSGDSSCSEFAKELYIGGLPLSISANVLKKFFEQAMERYGLKDMKNPNNNGDCVTRASLSGDGSYAFVEFRSVKETDRCISSLNGIPCMGSPLKIGRPAAYKGSGPSTGTFNPALASLPALNIDDKAAQKLLDQLEEKVGDKVVDAPAKIVQLENLVDEEMIKSFSELKTVGEEVEEECKEFGVVEYVYIPEVNADDRFVYVKFESIESATLAVDTLNGRTFDGRSLKAIFSSDRIFEKLPKTTTSFVPLSELTKKV